MSDEFDAAAEALTADADLDLVEFLQVVIETCAALVGADAGSIALIRPSGSLQSVASSTEDPGMAALLAVSATHGPTRSAATAAQSLNVSDVDRIASEWPAFHGCCSRNSIRSMHALPVRLPEGDVAGAMSLLFTRRGGVDPPIAVLLQTLIHRVVSAAAGALLHRTVDEHMEHIRDFRILIGRADGPDAEMHAPNVDDAIPWAIDGMQRREASGDGTASASPSGLLDFPNGHWTHEQTRRRAVAVPASRGGTNNCTRLLVDRAFARQVAELLQLAATINRKEGRKALARRHLARSRSILRDLGDEA